MPWLPSSNKSSSSSRQCNNKDQAWQQAQQQLQQAQATASDAQSKAAAAESAANSQKDTVVKLDSDMADVKTTLTNTAVGDSRPAPVRRSAAPLWGCRLDLVELHSTGQPWAAVPTWFVAPPVAGRRFSFPLDQSGFLAGAKIVVDQING